MKAKLFDVRHTANRSIDIITIGPHTPDAGLRAILAPDGKAKRMRSCHGARGNFELQAFAEVDPLGAIDFANSSSLYPSLAGPLKCPSTQHGFINGEPGMGAMRNSGGY